MDKSDLYDEEVVADSEEEDLYFPQKRASPILVTQSTSVIANSASSIQSPAFPTISHTNLRLVQTTEASNISDFTDKLPDNPGPSITSFTSVTIHKDASSSSAIVNDSNPNSDSSSIPKGRPKPRPAYRSSKDNPSVTNNSSSNKPPSPGSDVSNKMPKSNSFPDIQMATSSSTSNIAERAKMHSRARTKPTAPNPISSSVVSPSTKLNQYTKAIPVLSAEVIELSSDDDELALRSPPKTKAKAKPKPKHKPRTVSPDDLKATPKPKPIKRSRTSYHPTPPDSTSETSIPVPTSSLPIPFRLLPSQLPPSDPPKSTSTTTEFDHPPIAVLPNPNTSFDVDMRSSSPPLSPPKVQPTVRKRKLPQLRDEFDWGNGDGIRMDIDVDDNDTQRMPPPSVPAPLPPPPPTFFASSSPVNPEPDPRVEAEAVDLSTLILSTSKGVSKKKASKAKPPTKPRKNKGDMVDGDGETKAKPNTKNKDGKGKKGIATRDQVEVVIEVPAAVLKGKSKGKGKEKEVFKSREFIDDDDDDDEAVGASVVGLNWAAESTMDPKPISSISISNVPDSDVEVGASVSGEKRKMMMDHGDSGEDDERVDSPKKKQKSKGKGNGKEDVGGRKQKKGVAKGKDKGKMVILSEDDEADDDNVEGSVMASRGGKSGKGKSGHKDEDKASKKAEGTVATPGVGESVDESGIIIDGGGPGNSTKENVRPDTSANSNLDVCTTPKESLFPKLSSRYTIAPRTKSTPMSELIRRVNSLPGSPFSTPHPRASASKLQSTPNGTAYSPYLKSSRSLLSRIAPLHPNRRTPPPPLPPPPPPKKTKKEREREERWEEELVESVGGVGEWACLTDAERKEMRKVKREREMGGWED